MKTALIKFFRFNPDDEEYAQQNFPNLPRRFQLVAQFVRELSENHDLIGRWHVLKVHHESDDEMTLNVQLWHSYDERQPLVDAIQRCYDEFALTGHFEVVCFTEGDDNADPAMNKWAE